MAQIKGVSNTPLLGLTLAAFFTPLGRGSDTGCSPAAPAMRGGVPPHELSETIVFDPLQKVRGSACGVASYDH